MLISQPDPTKLEAMKQPRMALTDAQILALSAPLSQEQIDTLFPAEISTVGQTCFEIALVLGGTVSAGAYTAGVLDFLFEALDAWTKAKQEDQKKVAAGAQPSVPWHDVKLKLIAGTSGGGVCAAIAAKAAAYEFPPVRINTPEPDKATNPFYHVWVNQFDIAGFCAPGGETPDVLTSLLNPVPIAGAASQVTSYSGLRLGSNFSPATRDYLADPLRLIFPITNLPGIPYKVDFTSTNLDGSKTVRSQCFVDHADYARFAIAPRGPNGTTSGDVADRRPDEFVVGDAANCDLDWPGFATFARATGAFPVGFPPVGVRRPPDHYRYQVTLQPQDDGSFKRMQMPVDWGRMMVEAAGTYSFLCADGGATDNQPIELARTALAGIAGRNPRAENQAVRAVVLIDPFADSTTPQATSPQSSEGDASATGKPEAEDNDGDVFSIAAALLGTWKDQARYDTRDIMLAADDTVFSRFMITPVRKDKNGATITGGKAIASAALQAFSGFLFKDYRDHDYLLGRANCQSFLQNSFVLASNNPVMQGKWKAAYAAPYAIPGKPTMLPIIPVMGTAANSQDLAAWPTKNETDLGAVNVAISSRIADVLKRLKTTLDLGAIAGAFAWLGGLLLDGTIDDKVEASIKAGLKDWDLLSDPSSVDPGAASNGP
jgi:hypothetical protein